MGYYFIQLLLMFRLVCFALTAFVMSSCSNSSGKRGATIITPNTPSPFNFQPIPAASQQPATLPTTQMPAGSQTATTTSSAALNPAHGQPGHRCDISVGAPLNSAPISTTIPATSTMPATSQPTQAVAQVTPTTQPTTTSTTKAGLNPAHGEPGHRCDIQVGAPLNSAPVTVATTPATITTTPVTTTSHSLPSVTQVLPSAPVTTDKNVKLNPAHGQPGHDCAIALGQPLKN